MVRGSWQATLLLSLPGQRSQCVCEPLIIPQNSETTQGQFLLPSAGDSVGSHRQWAHDCDEEGLMGQGTDRRGCDCDPAGGGGGPAGDQRPGSGQSQLHGCSMVARRRPLRLAGEKRVLTA